MMLKNIRLSIKVAFVSALLFVISYSVVFAAEPFGPSLSKQAFTILNNGDRAVLGAEFMGATYGPKDTMTVLEAKLASIPEKKRLAVPEYLIVRQYKMTLNGNLKGIIADYKTDEDKQAARKSFANFPRLQKYCREKTAGIRFVNKCQFGNWVRIRFKRLNKNPKGFSLPWTLYLQKFGNRYYFVTGPANVSPSNPTGNIYNPVAEIWPYWKPEAERGSNNRLVGLDVMTILPSEESPKNEKTALKIYYKPEVFPPRTLLFGAKPNITGRKLSIWRSIKKVVETYRSGKFDAIMALWDEENQKILERDPQGVEFAANTKFWTEAQDAQIDFMLDSGTYCWIYLVPEYKAKADKPPRKGRVKILAFHTVAGKNYLTDATRFLTPPKDSGPLFTEQIIITPEFRHGLVEASKH